MQVSSFYFSRFIPDFFIEIQRITQNIAQISNIYSCKFQHQKIFIQQLS